MHEIENFESGMGAVLGATAYGLMGAAAGIGDAIGAAIRHEQYLKRVDSLTRGAVRQTIAARRARAETAAEVQAMLSELAIARYNDSLREAA